MIEGLAEARRIAQLTDALKASYAAGGYEAGAEFIQAQK